MTKKKKKEIDDLLMPDTLKLRVSHEDGIFKRKLEKKKTLEKYLLRSSSKRNGSACTGSRCFGMQEGAR